MPSVFWKKSMTTEMNTLTSFSHISDGFAYNVSFNTHTDNIIAQFNVYINYDKLKRVFVSVPEKDATLLLWLAIFFSYSNGQHLIKLFCFIVSFLYKAARFTSVYPYHEFP